MELAKLCTDKSIYKRHTVADFSTLFKDPADRSGFGTLKLCNKYLSAIPFYVYCKIELEKFAIWAAADKCTTEVEQQLDISWAHWPKLNSFFSAQGGAQGRARGDAPWSQGASASINATIRKEDFPGNCYSCGKKGYKCPKYKDKPYTKHTDVQAMVASGST